VKAEELIEQPDHNLYALMSNASVSEAIRREAAFLLWVRNSKFISTTDFAPFKTACIERSLTTAAAEGTSPEKWLDSVSHLNVKAEQNAGKIVAVEQRHDAELNALDGLNEQRVRDAARALTVQIAEAQSLLLGKLAETDARLARTATVARRLAIGLGITFLLATTGILLRFLH